MSAVVFASLVSSSLGCELLSGKTVLELGAGVGLASLAAAAISPPPNIVVATGVSAPESLHAVAVEPCDITRPSHTLHTQSVWGLCSLPSLTACTHPCSREVQTATRHAWRHSAITTASQQRPCCGETT